MNYRGRFAPSPTGELHRGSLLAAVASYLRARNQHGQWLVRIEDLDPPREVPGSTQKILQSLAAIGLRSDAQIMWQSQRHDAYQNALQFLIEQKQAYACWCSRSQLGEDAKHIGECVAPEDPQRIPAWRIRAPNSELIFTDLIQGRVVTHMHQQCGDFVIKRADGYWAYQLAVVVDDAWQQITEVVRGADLLESTSKQIYLQQLLGLKTPDYAHIPLLLDAQGQKLSKHLESQPINCAAPIPAILQTFNLLGIDTTAMLNIEDVSELLQIAAKLFALNNIPSIYSYALQYN